MTEQSEERTQRLTLENRRRLSVGGVEEVERFDEAEAVLRTSAGALTVRGAELRLLQLTAGNGLLAVEGRIDALVFEEERRQGGLLARLFG